MNDKKRLPKKHRLKTHIPYWEHAAIGIKSFEFRKNDRGFAPGDVLVLAEWNQQKELFTGREATTSVRYILYEGFGIPEGFCIMGLGPLKVTMNDKDGNERLIGMSPNYEERMTEDESSTD